MVDNVIKGSNINVEECNRCHDEKEVNKFGLCKACQLEVDHEYSSLYRIKNMDY
ncbi:MAG: hypothetical protein ACQEQE_02320 [Bacillota bacterium]|mgnify:CR=1 FL=1